MTAVVRLKRRINDEPISALILNCKRRKLENETEVNESLLATKDEISTILKFAGTVDNQVENVTTQLKKLNKDDARQLALKCRIPNIQERSRQDMKQNTQVNRFKVVNCCRSLNEEDIGAQSQNAIEEITIVDIEKQAGALSGDGENRQAVPQNSRDDQNDSDFVYDLYLPENDQQTSTVDLTDSSYLSVRLFDDLIYESREARDEASDEDSEDSNKESYYRNDYPDTEEESNYSSIGEGDMYHAVNNSNYDNELSSDEDDRDDFIHSIDLEGSDFEDDEDYHSYKRNFQKKVNDDFEEDD